MIIPNETGTKTAWCTACYPGNLPEVFRVVLEIDPFDETLYPLGYHSDPELLFRIFDFSEPTRRIFWQARDRRPKAVHPAALLVRELTRRGMRCPTQLRVMGKPLSSFFVLVGRSGTGKTEAQQPDALAWPGLAAPKWLEDLAARRVVPQPPAGGKSSAAAATGITAPSLQPILIPHDFDDVERLGSGQVLADHLLDLEGTGENKISKMKPHPAVWIQVDELSGLLDAAKSESSTIVPTLTEAWAGLPIGNSTRAHGRRVTNGPYNVFLLGGLQPKLAHKLLPHVDSGFFQRFVFVPVTDAYFLIGEPDQVSRPVNPAAPMPHITEQDTEFIIDPAIGPELEADLVYSYADHLPNEEDEERSQVNMVRLRLAALCALLHGTLTITYDFWRWAGWVMELSARTEAWMRVEVERSAAKAGYVKGKDQAYIKAAAQTVAESAMLSTSESITKKLVSAGSDGMTLGQLQSRASDKQKNFLAAALKHLIETVKTVQLVGPRYYLLGFAPAVPDTPAPDQTTAPPAPGGGIASPGHAGAPAPGTDRHATRASNAFLNIPEDVK